MFCRAQVNQSFLPASARQSFQLRVSVLALRRGVSRRRTPLLKLAPSRRSPLRRAFFALGHRTPVKHQGNHGRLQDRIPQPLRAARAIPISEAPPNSMLMPTRSPIAHSADPGSPVMMRPASTKSTIPDMSSQPHRSDSSRRCSNAYMMVEAPSAIK